jgi:hypothetical protein
MHSAIVVINMPEKYESEGHHPKWVACLADLSRASEPMVSSLEDQDGVLRLAENVWQINFHDNPGAFARLVSCAIHHKLTYGILQLKDAPVWHPAAFDKCRASFSVDRRNIRPFVFCNFCDLVC